MQGHAGGGDSPVEMDDDVFVIDEQQESDEDADDGNYPVDLFYFVPVL